MITFPIQAEIFAHFTRIFIKFKVLSCIKLKKCHFSRHIIFLITEKTLFSVIFLPKLNHIKQLQQQQSGYHPLIIFLRLSVAIIRRSSGSATGTHLYSVFTIPAMWDSVVRYKHARTVPYKCDRRNKYRTECDILL